MSSVNEELWQLLHDTRALIGARPLTAPPPRFVAPHTPEAQDRPAGARQQSSGAQAQNHAGARHHSSGPGHSAAREPAHPTGSGRATEEASVLIATGDGPVAALRARYADWTPERRAERLQALAAEVVACRRCPLAMGRSNAVPGTGVLDPLLMVIGEGPGADEDAQGLPFVGQAGEYLNKWLDAIGVDRTTETFIGNVVKCRPPGNRDPKPEESDACVPYLYEQIALVRPRAILTVGRISTRLLTGTTAGIGAIHGTFFDFGGIPLMPTYHPSGVLRNPNWRRPVWEDLKKLRQYLDTLVSSGGPTLP